MAKLFPIPRRMAVALPGIPPMASEFYARILELRDKDVKASPCAFSTIFSTSSLMRMYRSTWMHRSALHEGTDR